MNKAVGGMLPSSWLYHQDLKPLIEERDFEEVCEVVLGMRSPMLLPEPEKFFAAYSQHRQEHKQVQEEHNRVQAELPEIKDSLKAIKDALCGTG